LPAVYGTVIIPLIEIDGGQYVAGENIASVSAVYDKDGGLVTDYSFSDGIIKSPVENIKAAMVTGSANNKIGQIIIDIITTKTNIAYISSFFDLIETDRYVNSSVPINIAFTGGTVREAVKNTLSSDMAFLIQKNDGRFTLRQWGETYNTFVIENWKITKFPSKNYSDAQKNYFSSCFIYYNYNFSDKKHTGILLYDEDEAKFEAAYNKRVREEFKTYLTNKTDAYNLAKNLSKRFSTLHETVQLGVGYDTSEINLLDTVELELNINGRVFSKHNKWIVKEIDPAQDILTLESVISL
jgi:hypothetical protein